MLAQITLLFTVLGHVIGHLSIVEVTGSNGNTGHGFGVNLQGKFPRIMGAPGDAGGDSTVFETGTNNPTPACGSTPEWGALDIPAWLSQAEGEGLPAAYSNMSVVFTGFQVNRDGGGPMSCEFSQDATATSFEPMNMLLNQAGNSGIMPYNRHNATLVAEFPAGAKCSGGVSGAACIVRCRTGVNKRFGGCFAVKLADSPEYGVQIGGANSSQNTSANTPVRATETVGSQAASDSQMQTLVDMIIAQMKASGLVISASATQNGNASPNDSTNSNNSSDSTDTEDDTGLLDKKNNLISLTHPVTSPARNVTRTSGHGKKRVCRSNRH